MISRESTSTMATPRLGTKGKRLLPGIPQNITGVKRGVNFNCETIETSIGGTQTPGRLKGDPLSPMNRLSSDETTRRSENSVSMDESEIDVSNGIDSVAAPLCVKSSIDPSNADDNVSVEITVSSHAGMNCDSESSDKENSPRDGKGLNINQTPMRGYQNYFSNGNDDIHPLQIYSPSPNMKVRYGTPLRRHTLDEKLLGTPECYSVVQLDRNRYDFGLFDDRNGDGEDSCSVTVAVRMRPFSQRYVS